MRRALATIAICCSTLLLVLAAADWAYSLRNSETFTRVRGRGVYAIDNYKGEISLWAGELTAFAWAPDGWSHAHWDAPNARSAKDFNIINPTGSEIWFAGFGITTQRRIPARTAELEYDDVTNVTGVVIPSWFLSLLFALLPTRALVSFIRNRRRFAEGCCPCCGYDLRASTDRCPECGRAIEPIASLV
jgi:hypothetical protein